MLVPSAPMNDFTDISLFRNLQHLPEIWIETKLVHRSALSASTVRRYDAKVPIIFPNRSIANYLMCFWQLPLPQCKLGILSAYNADADVATTGAS